MITREGPIRILVTAFILSALACQTRRSINTGRQMFEGERPVQGMLSDDDAVLPATASRCANCHQWSEASPPDGGTQAIGPALTKEWLLALRRRRGGPASRYDLTSFCTLLRTGVDPAHVLIQRTMPRYQVDETGCRALWDFLTSGGGRP